MRGSMRRLLTYDGEHLHGGRRAWQRRRVMCDFGTSGRAERRPRQRVGALVRGETVVHIADLTDTNRTAQARPSRDAG